MIKKKDDNINEEEKIPEVRRAVTWLYSLPLLQEK